MKWVLFALHLAALFSIARYRIKLPAFTGYLLLNMPLVVSYRPESTGWWYSFFAYYEPILIIARTLVTIEAMLLLTEGLDRGRLRTLLLTVCAAGGLLSISAWDFHEHATWFLTVRDLRAAEYVRLLITCVLVGFLLDARSWRFYRARCLHFGIWAVWVARQVAMALIGRVWPKEWHSADEAGYLIGCGCLFAWVVTFALTARSRDRREERRSLVAQSRTVDAVSQRVRALSASSSFRDTRLLP